MSEKGRGTGAGSRLLQIKRAGIDAIAQAGLVARTIIKDMPQVRIAALADHLDPPHPVAADLRRRRNVAVINHIPESWASHSSNCTWSADENKS